MNPINLNGEAVVEVQQEEFKIKRLSPFDFVQALSTSKEYLLNDNTMRDFAPFMVNRAFSQHVDTIMIANEMNKVGRNKLFVHDFYFYSLPARKRYGKWAKADESNNDTVDLLCRHYCINRTRAHEYLLLLSNTDIENIKKMYETGGTK